MYFKLKPILFLSTIVIVSGQPIKEGSETQVVYQNEILFRENAGPIVLDCAIEARVKSYQWLRNRAPVSKLPNKSQFIEITNGSLLIPSPSKYTEAVYQCLAETQHGTASSPKYIVKRTFIKLTDVKTSDLTPIRGRPFNLECPIPEGYPKPTAIWVKESEPEVPVLDKRITLTPDGKLWFSNATDEDVTKEDSFVCLVSSPAIKKPVEVTKIRVSKLVESNEENKGELVAQYLSGDVVALVGETTAIFCIYGGTPLAHPDWFKDGVNVNGQPGDRVTRHNRSAGKRLLIKDTRPEDAGIYTCVVDNEVGAKKTHTINVKVEAKPVFIKTAVKNLKVKQGEKLYIPCQVSGVPEPNVSWTFNSRALLISNNVNNSAFANHEGLTMNAGFYDEGYYGCVAENTHGYLYTEFSVTFD